MRWIIGLVVGYLVIEYVLKPYLENSPNTDAGKGNGSRDTFTLVKKGKTEGGEDYEVGIDEDGKVIIKGPGAEKVRGAIKDGTEDAKGLIEKLDKLFGNFGYSGGKVGHRKGSYLPDYGPLKITPNNDHKRTYPGPKEKGSYAINLHL